MVFTMTPCAVIQLQTLNAINRTIMQSQLWDTVQRMAKTFGLLRIHGAISWGTRGISKYKGNQTLWNRVLVFTVILNEFEQFNN